MNLTKSNNTLVIEDNLKTLKVYVDDYGYFYLGFENKGDMDKPTTMIFKKNNGVIYDNISDLHDNLTKQYLGFKDYYDFQYNDIGLYSEKNNSFKFYKQYSKVQNNNCIRIFEKNGTYFLHFSEMKDNKACFIIGKNDTMYSEFNDRFFEFYKSLNKSYTENLLQKSKRMEGNINGQQY